MFKDLVRSSGCKQFGKGTKTVSEQTLRQIMRDEADLLLRPSGFVFHESRCGSTLVANMLTRYDSGNLVYSESTPPSKILNHCAGCNEERKVELFRLAIDSM